MYTTVKLTTKNILQEYEIPSTKQNINRVNKLRVKILRYARGSLYRMNASTADIYTFGIDHDLKDFSGGYAWLGSKGTHDSDFCVNLSTGKFLKIVYQQ
jgi:hypothetical protein